MDLLNDSIKIGIARTLSLIGVEENYKEIVELNGYNPEYCSKIGCDNCRLMQTLGDEEQERLISNSCKRNCPYFNEKIAIYKNEKNDYKIKEVLLLSKSRIKQYLYYHGLCDSLGGVFDLSIKQIKKDLGLTERTIKDNNDFFVDKQLICLSHVEKNVINLFITSYKDYFKSKQEYGRGYLDISKEVLIKLLEATNIADIRFTLRSLIEYSKQNRFYDNSYTYVGCTYKKLKRILPSYINCPKKINSFLQDSKIKIFNTKFTDDGIEYILKDQFDSRKIKNHKEKDYKFNITGHILKQSRQLGWKIIGQPINNIFEVTNLGEYIDDFVQMAQQYNLELVLDAIEDLLEIMFKDGFNGNCGAVVRNIIRDTVCGQAVSN